MVLGGHGDSMVPLKRYSSVGGIPIAELLDDPTIEKLIDRTRKGGGEIVGYLKTGSAYYAPGASAAKMVEAVIKDEKRLLPASVYLRGEYGYHNIFLGVPVVIGQGGAEKIIEAELDEGERAALDRSAAAVQEGVDLLDTFYSPG
jgi:malate dehydrogenase